MKDGVITIYTDGAARGNPGKAGWGVVVIHGDNVHELGGRTDHATNNQMELTAAIEGLKYIKSKISRATLDISVEVFADSKYVINGVNEWIHNWLKNNWRTATNKPVLNQELWQELHALNQSVHPVWHYVKGHNGDRWNDRADLIATSFADGEPVELKK